MVAGKLSGIHFHWTYPAFVATTADLIAEGFASSTVVPTTLNIDHPDPTGRGPFCRLIVTTTAPASPGAYAWVTNDDLRYIGKARDLLQIVHGTRMGRPYNDYTYVPPSKVRQIGNPRVRINGLLNAAICEGQVITWWWWATETEVAALQFEAELIDRWRPPWNRALPTFWRRT